VQDVLNWPDRIKAISAAQVQNAAKTWLDKRRSATGYLVKSLPAPEEKRS
jgi:zinc protease